MSSTLRVLLLLSLGCLLVACEAATSSLAGQSTSVALETEDQKTLYALGQVLGQNVANANLSEDELAFVQMGLSDSILAVESRVSLDEYGPKLQPFMAQRMQAAAEVELTEALAFVEEHAAVDGAVRTESGLVIQEITAGSGASPTATDTVTVHYHGTLRDGSVFGSSVDRGEPATFPLNQVVPCWPRACRASRWAARAGSSVPPNLAYGPDGRPGIPGNAALVYEVELLEIVQ